MSLCPSSSHQLVAAAIAFRRARRKFPKDYGLESTIEYASESAKTETTSSHGRSINQARSSSLLVRRACNSRSDHVCPASVRGRDYSGLRIGENSISCNCCRARKGEDISELRDECSGGDAIDTVPSREREEFATSDADKNEFVKPAERDRCDTTSTKKICDEAKTKEPIPQYARSTFYRHRKARCPSRPRSNPVNFLYDVPREKDDKTACGDTSEDRDKDYTSCHGTSIDLDESVEEDVVTSDAGGRGTSVEDVRTKPDTLTPHRRKIVDFTWRCQCELHSRDEFSSDLSGPSCDRCCNGCHRQYHHRRDCPHWYYCCQQCDSAPIDPRGYETRGRICDRAGRVQCKSWRDQMRGENSQAHAWHCYSRDSDIISAARERNVDEKRENVDDGGNDDDDNDVAVINHKDSMCILAEKYKAGRRFRGRRCDFDKARSGDRTVVKDECNKSLTTETIDQSQPRERHTSMKHVCRAHCESCRTAVARTCGRGCRHAPTKTEFDRSKSPSSEMAAVRYCSTRASCKRAL